MILLNLTLVKEIGAHTFRECPKLKEIDGTIVDICSKIKLEIESPQQFGKTLNRNKDILRKNGISITMKRGKNNNNYQVKYNSEDVIY